MFTSAWFSATQNVFIQKFKHHFCNNIRRTYAVRAMSKTYEAEDFLKRKFSLSFKNDFIFQFPIYFSTSFAFYFLVSYTYFQTSTMISFNIEMVNSGKNSLLWNLFIKFYVAIATFKNLLNMVILEDGHSKVSLNVLRYAAMYTY